MTVINMGNEACDYAMDIASDPDGAFTVDATSGTIEGQGTKDITFTFSTPVAGEAEGLATIESESSDEPFNIQLSGTILPPPDFHPSSRAVISLSEPILNTRSFFPRLMGSRWYALLHCIGTALPQRWMSPSMCPREKWA